MNICKNYSHSAIDLYERSLVESSVELEEFSKSLPMPDRGDRCGYGYGLKKELPLKFPYVLESTVGNPTSANVYVREKKVKKKKEKIAKVMKKKKIGAAAAKTKNFVGKCCRVGASTIQRVLLMCFWFWVCISLINLFKSADTPKVKFHAVIPKEIRYSNYKFHPTQIDAEEITFNLELYGPFIPKLVQNREYNEDMMQGEHVFLCTLERWILPKMTTNPVLYKLERKNAIHIDSSPTAFQKIMMVNATGTTHQEPLDYNNYPREVRLSLPKTTGDATAGSVFYALGFSCYPDQQKSVPFSLEYMVDTLGMGTRVLIGVIPLIVMIALKVLKVNIGVAAFLAMATALAGFVKTGAEVKVQQTGQWLHADIVLFAFASMMLVSIMAEAKLYMFFAWHLLKLTKFEINLALLFLNAVTGAMCVFFNNMFIGMFMAPLAITMMEFLDRNPYPVLINLMTMCNICGKAFVGTFIIHDILNHTEAINANIKLLKILEICMIPALIGAAVTSLIWFVIYRLCRPHMYRERLELVEAQHELRLFKRLYQSIPDISKDWHLIRMKLNEDIEALKKHIQSEKEKPKLMFVEVREPHRDFRVNWFLAIKLLVATGAFGGLMVIYFYNLEIPEFHEYGEVRLGHLSLYALLLLFLLLHSRDFELLLKRIDWQAITIFVAFGIISSVFQTLTSYMDDHLWKLYGATATGSRKRKVHLLVLQMLSFSSVAGVCNEHVTSLVMLDTVIIFSIFRGFDAIPEILGGFIVVTGLWANASILGSHANIAISGMGESQGYRFKFLQHMVYGVPIAVINVGVLYMYIGFRHLI